MSLLQGAQSGVLQASQRRSPIAIVSLSWHVVQPVPSEKICSSGHLFLSHDAGSCGPLGRPLSSQSTVETNDKADTPSAKTHLVDSS